MSARLLLFAALLTLFSCDKTPDEIIVGTWKIVAADCDSKGKCKNTIKYGSLYEFDDNGKIHFIHKKSKKHIGSYEIDEKKFTRTMNGIVFTDGIVYIRENEILLRCENNVRYQGITHKWKRVN